MSRSLYVFAEVEAKTATPQTINNAIKEVLRANGGVAYADIEPYLMPPGLSGSKSFDQAYAVDVLLRHAKEQGSQLAAIMEEHTDRVGEPALC